MYYTIQRNRDEAWLSLVETQRSGRRVACSNHVASIHLGPDGQAVKTTPSHGVNPVLIPGQVILQGCCICSGFYFKNEYAIVAQLVAQRTLVMRGSPVRKSAKLALNLKENLLKQGKSGFPAVLGIFLFSLALREDKYL